MCTLDSFSWLPGLYSMTIPGGLIVETWAREPESGYHGTAVTVKSGNRVSIEKMRIELANDRVVFVADVPHNKREVAFELVEHSDHDGLRFVFENREHDFPQRVIYHYYPENGRLVGRIEGTLKGEFKSVDFPYARLK